MPPEPGALKNVWWLGQSLEKKDTFGLKTA